MPDQAKSNPNGKQGAVNHGDVRANPTQWIKDHSNDAVFLNAHGNQNFERIYNDRLQKAFGGE
jgi:hypothetical protein